MKMDELLKLERMQSVLSSLKSHGLVSSLDSANHDSNRFVANLVLLLVQPCGGLNLDEKCSLVSEFVQKISGAFLEDVASSLRREDRSQNGINNSGSHSDGGGDPSIKSLNLTRNRGKIHVLVDKIDENLLQRNFEEMAMVGLDAMQRANSTLEDFCRSYFMFHGLDIENPQVMFKYLPVLSFTESYIYQVDTVNERIVEATTSKAHSLRKEDETQMSHGLLATFMALFDSGPFRPLARLLENSGLLTDRIRQEFRFGEEYWKLERKLCGALADKQEISVDDVMRAVQLKSFDYRVLNLLLYQLQREEVNDLHMEFLSISEFLVEVSDDLFDYEVTQEDVLGNNFNILRMFVRIYGPSNAPARLAKFITEAEDKYEALLETLDPDLSSKYRRRCEEATKEGGTISGHPFGTWNIPPVIANEELYRLSYSKFQ